MVKNCVRSIDETLTGTTNSGKSGPGVVSLKSPGLQDKGISIRCGLVSYLEHS